MKSNLNVQITDSRSKRRVVLMSAKSMAEQLRDFNSLKKLRERKRKKLTILSNLMSEIGVALDEVKIKDVPSVHIVHPGEEPKVEIKKVEPQKVKQTVVKPVEAPKMDKKEEQLIRELEDIDKKLASL